MNNNNHYGWSHISGEVMEMIIDMLLCSKETNKELLNTFLNLSLVCHDWHDICQDPLFWKKLAREIFGSTELPQKGIEMSVVPHPINEWKSHVLSMAHEFQEFIEVYGRVMRCVNIFRKIISEEDLRSCYSLRELSLLEAKELSTDPSVICLLHLLGQQTHLARPLFGAYSFYQQSLELFFSPKYPNIVIVDGRKSKIMAIHKDTGNLFEMNMQTGTSLILGESFLDYLENFTNRLVCGDYQLSGNTISLYPHHNGVSRQKKRGIMVECSPVFVSERSVESPHLVFLWAYQIRLSMDKSESSANSAVLVTRNWEIKSANGQVENVSGEGVIGLFPTISPGSFFQYESCCPLYTRSGSMKGTFQMRNLRTNELFDVVVPEFFFESAPFRSLEE